MILLHNTGKINDVNCNSIWVPIEPFYIGKKNMHQEKKFIKVILKCND